MRFDLTRMITPTTNRRRVSDLQMKGIPLPEFDQSPKDESAKQKLTRSKSVAFGNGIAAGKGILPIVSVDGSVPQISAETLSNVLKGGYDEFFDNLYIIDTRFSYEYEGGHIKGAQNCNSPSELYEQFFTSPERRALMIFHCELSKNRGPLLSSLFREKDRELNMEAYPFLNYPDVYVLSGGYKEFYSKFPELCDGGYVRMLDSPFKSNGLLVRENTKFKKEIEKIQRVKSITLFESNSQKSSECLKSPSQGFACHSPLVSKTLNLLASPIVQK